MAKLRFLPVLLIFVLFIFGCGNQNNVVKTVLNEKVSLHIGQAATIASENFSVKFIGIPGDSRCPTGVQCITAGQVTCTIEITQGPDMMVPTAQTSQITITQPGGTGGEQQIFNNFLLQYNITPYPAAGKTIKQTDYLLHLSISRYN
jgi:hypothetical protein